MNAFLQLISSFPVIVPTILVGVLLVFWLLAIFGALHFDHFGPDWLGSHDVEHVSDTDLAPSMIVALGFDRLPFSIVVSVIGFFWWVLTLLTQHYLLSWLPLPVGFTGTVVLILALFAALPFAGACVRPLKPIFAKRGGATRVSLIGRSCKITTLTVDAKFGQAEVIDENNAHHLVKVWARTPNELTRGSGALILSHDVTLDRFEVEAYEP